MSGTEPRRRYAIVGTGARAEMFVRGITRDHADAAELVALCDRNPLRAEAHNRWLTAAGHPAVPHPGAVRNHNRWLHAAHERDVGGDVPQATDCVHGLAPLLDAYGNDPGLRLVVYTLYEDTYTRELAPPAGGYAALYLGAPWWFLDTPDGLRRFREAVTDTAGFYNTAGFVDDTRAFCSIPVRHDVARRVDAAHLATLVGQGRLPYDEAAETIQDLAYHLPKRIFRLDGGAP